MGRDRGIARGSGQMPLLSGAASPRCGEVNILNKKIWFLVSTNFEALRRMRGNLVNGCDVFKVYYFFMGGHYVYSPWAQINLVMPLGKERDVTFVTVCLSVI
jgi:hypothetical protein